MVIVALNFCEMRCPFNILLNQVANGHSEKENVLMLDKSQLINFVATCNAAKVREFYENILGLDFISDDQFAIVFESHGTMLRIQKVEKVNPHKYTVLGWRVDDIRKDVRGLSKRGVRFSRYAGMDQDEIGIWIAHSKAKIAWFADPDGNILSLTEFESTEI